MKRTGGKRMAGLFLAAGLVFCMAVGFTAAYFTDRIEAEASSLETGSLRFQYPDQSYGIIADFTEADAYTQPYQEGDKIRLQFKSILSGTAAALAVPRLTVTTEGGTETDCIEVSAVPSDEETTAGTQPSATVDGAGILCYDTDIRRVEPGREEQFAYEISIPALTSDSALQISFDFALAAVQENYNDGAKACAPNELFEQIAARYEGQSAENNELIGFTDLCTLERAVDQNGASAEPADRMQYRVELHPQITPGNPAEGSLTWYQMKDGGEKILRSVSLQGSGSDEWALQLMLSSKNLDATYRYEVRNEAGIQPSPVFRFYFSDAGELVCERRDYMEDLSGR